jgi:hypothetical protein
VLLPVARDPAETQLYIELTPCACGESRFPWRSNTVIETEDGSWVSTQECLCPGCGVLREFLVGVPDWPTAAPDMRYGGPEPSELIDPGMWLWIGQRFGEAAYRAQGDGDRRQYRDLALDALTEVLRFIPEGETFVPRTAFWTEESLDLHDRDPHRFTLTSLRTFGNDLRLGRQVEPVMRRLRRPAMRDRLVQALMDRLAELVDARDWRPVLSQDCLLQIRALLGPATGPDPLAWTTAAVLRWERYRRMAPTERGQELSEALRLFAGVRDQGDVGGDLEPAAVTLILDQRVDG